MASAEHFARPTFSSLLGLAPPTLPLLARARGGGDPQETHESGEKKRLVEAGAVVGHSDERGLARALADEICYRENTDRITVTNQKVHSDQ